MKTKSNSLSALAKAQKLPPPSPGLRLASFMKLEVFLAAVNLHGLEIERVSGGMVTVRKTRGAMVKVAESLAKVGE